ncbi:MAG TPA: HlyD family type I secretion periplasmic adaptor subunit [Nitrospiraceae bacterium]|nr:HlyD family type I secretion periplasmic adaptor subunit [Nitrospiraceae bacterium]
MSRIQIGKHLAAWRSAWQESRQPVGVAPSGPSVEFLPAVLEIQEAPPSPIGRAISIAIMAALLTGVLWAVFSRIDVVAVAQGKIIPSVYTKVIQPLESGVVRGIYVRDGQYVHKGEVLLDLDPTAAGADRDRYINEYRSAKVEAARLRALIAGKATFDPPADSLPQFVMLQQQMLRDQLSEYEARVEAAGHLVAQRKAALDATKEHLARLQATVPIEEERAEAYKRLLQDQFVSKMDYLQFEQQRIDKAQELAAQRQKLIQDRAALAESQKNYGALIAEFHQARQAELSAAEIKATSLEQEVVKAEQRTEFQTLIAPVDGVVQQLAIHTVGGVVTPAQQVMMVVPRESTLDIEAWVENKDIGFVTVGQPVEIKVETFPFTLYGTIDGRLISVSDDAVPQEKAGLIYAARVSMARSTMLVEGKRVNLSPGMAVTVEIKTGTRRAIEYFLSPLLKSVKESIRER